MLINNYTRLLGALLIAKAAIGSPTPHVTESLVKREDSPKPWFQIFGDDQGPKLQHLADAFPIIRSLIDSQPIGDGTIHWLTLLAGFQMCTEFWPLSFFPEQNNHPEQFPKGQGYSLPLNSTEWKRHAVLANLGEMNNLEKLVPGLQSNDLVDQAWWPWALLEGAQSYAWDKQKVDFGVSVLTLSGFLSIVIEGDDLKAAGIQDTLWNDVYVHANESPVWVQYGSDGQDFHVVRNRTEDSIGIYSLGFDYQGKGAVKGDIRYRSSTSVGDIPHRVIHLKDFAKFQGRVGAWEQTELYPK